MRSPRLFTVALFSLFACAKSAPPAGRAPSGAAAADPKAPVARIGAEVITEGELQSKSKAAVGRIEAEHAQKVYEARKQALDDMIDKRLIDARAKKEGLTPEKLVEREVTAKLPTPTDAEIQQVYDRAKAAGQQLPALPEVKDDIAKFLRGRSEGDVRKAFMDRLRADAKVQVMLPPAALPRVEIAADGPSKGDPKARVTIYEFSDFQCPFCGRAEPTVKRVLDEYKGKVRLVYLDYPLPFHPLAQKASEAALCAGDQGKYWEMHEKLFADQSALAVPQLKGAAKALGLDTGKFDRCLDGGDKVKAVETAKRVGEEAGVTGTPAFFINGRLISGARPFEDFKAMIDGELAAGG
jgi:protein-disulfide isomerase